MKPVAPLVALFATVALGACTWVKMEPEGLSVRVVATDAAVQDCTTRGEIGVSVKDKVGLYRRNDLKVRDELETMARNEAVGLGADTILPLDEPVNGEQRFAAYRCGAAAASSRANRAQPRSAPPSGQPLQVEEVETYPIRDE